MDDLRDAILEATGEGFSVEFRPLFSDRGGVDVILRDYSREKIVKYGKTIFENAINDAMFDVVTMSVEELTHRLKKVRENETG